MGRFDGMLRGKGYHLAKGARACSYAYTLKNSKNNCFLPLPAEAGKQKDEQRAKSLVQFVPPFSGTEIESFIAKVSAG